VPQVAVGLGAAFTGFTAAMAASPLLAAAVQIGASVALSAAAKALAPRPQSQAQTVSVRAPVVPRDIVYGRVRKGGVLIFAHRTRNDGKDFLHLIYALAGHQVQAIEAVYFDGEEAINVTQGTRSAKYQDSLQWDVRLGTATQSAIANAFLPTSVWGADHRCLGVPLLYIRLRGEADDYPNGIPNVTVLLRGRNEIFDPRTNSTGWTTNAALCLADYLAWSRFGLGLGYGAEGGIDTATLIAAANVCDEQVARAPGTQPNPGLQIFPVVGAPSGTGVTEPRYTCNGVLSTAASPKENVEALLTAMGGRAIYTADRWRIYAAAYTPPTVALTAADIRENGINVQTRRSIADNFNRVRGQFVAPENDWQPDDFPAYTSATYLAEDQGIESWRDIALPMTISAGTAQRLAKIELERTRRQQVVQVSGMLSAWRAQVGDTVTLDYPRWGWFQKPFEVRKVMLAIQDGALVPELTLAEASPLQYDWNATEEQIYAAAPQTSLPDPFQIGSPGAPVIAEELYLTRTGTVEAKAVITWPASEGPFVSGYEVQWRKTAGGLSPPNLAWTTLVSTTELRAEQLAMESGARMEWRVQAVNTFGARSEWASASRTIVGLNALPVALTGVTIQSNGNMAVLKWGLPADLDVRIGGRVLIRHSASNTPSWANSVTVDEVAGSTTTATVPLKPGTYLLRASDSRGFLGPVTGVSTKGATWVPFVNVSTITESPTFPGAKTNVTVVSSTLRLTSPSLVGVYTFNAGLDLGSEQAVRLRSVIDVSAISLTTTIDQRTDLIDTWPDFDGTEGADTDAIVEVRTTDDNPAGSPTWSAWTRLDATEEAFRGAQFRVRLLSRSADFVPAVLALSVRVDEVA
jgi:hypothetical protein